MRPSNTESSIIQLDGSLNKTITDITCITSFYLADFPIRSVWLINHRDCTWIRGSFRLKFYHLLETITSIQIGPSVRQSVC